MFIRIGGRLSTAVMMAVLLSVSAQASDVASRTAAVNTALETSADIPSRPVTSSTFERPNYLLYGSPPLKWGSITVGTPAEVRFSFFDPANGPTKSQPNGLPYVSTPLLDRHKAAVRQALHAWEEVANIRYIEVPDSSPLTQIRIGQGFFKAGQADGSNLVAAADVPCNGCQGATANILTFSSELFPTSRQTESTLIDVALHEVGHTLGLDHETVVSSTMGFGQRRASLVQLKGVTDDDITAAQLLYGANTNPTKIIEDDVEGTAHTDTMLYAGQSFAGRIETAADEDWFRLPLVPGNDYVITVRPGEKDGVAQPRAELRFSDLGRVGSASWSVLTATAPAANSAAQIMITPNYAGSYWVAVKTARETSTGTYVVDVQETSRVVTASSNISEGLVDLPDSTLTNGLVVMAPAVLNPPPSSVTGYITGSADADWFSFTPVAGQSYQIDLSGVAGAGLPLDDAFLILRNNSGAYIANDDNSGGGKNARIVFTAQSATPVYLDVRSGQHPTRASANAAFPDYAGHYRLTVSLAPPEGLALRETGDIAGSLASAATIADRQSITGTVGGSADRSDWIKAKLGINRAYVAELKGVDGGGGTLADPVLRLRGPEGQVWGVRDDTAGTRDGSLIFFQNDENDQWLEVSGFGAQAGTYTLTLNELSIQQTAVGQFNNTEVGGYLDTSAVLPLDGVITNTLDVSNDVEGYHMLLTAGGRYVLSADALVATAHGLAVAIRAPDGSVIDYNVAAPGQPARLYFTPTVTGKYLAQVISPKAGVTGAYKVTLSMYPPYSNDDAPDTPYFFEPPMLRVGQALNLVMNELDDRDWISADVAPNTWYLIEAAPQVGASMTAAPIFAFTSPDISNVDLYQAGTDARGVQVATKMYVRSNAGGTIQFSLLSTTYGAAFGDGRYQVTMSQQAP